MSLRFVLAILLCCGVIAANAQREPVSKSAPDPAPRHRPADANQARLQEGRMFPEFEGMLLNGDRTLFTLDRIRQHVSVVCFWYPSCNCINPAQLDTFRRFAGNPRFQLVSIMPDSFNYSAAIREKPVPGLHVRLNDNASIYELNLLGGYPVAMLLDGNGKVLKAAYLNRPGAFDPAEWLARINEALMF